VGAVGELLDQVEEGRLGPVEVVEHGHQRPLGGQGLQQAAGRPDGLLDRGRVGLQPDQLADPLGHQRPVRRAPVQQGGQFGPCRRRRVLQPDPGSLADHLGQRPEGAAVAVRQAAADQDRRPLPEPAGRLQDQPGLADPGPAEHGQEVQGGVAGGPLVGPLEQLQLRGPADERGVVAAGAAGRARAHRQQPVGRLARLAPGQGQDLGRLDLDGVADQAPGAAAEQDLTGAGRLLQPGGQVDRIPDHQRAAQAGIAGHHLAGVDAGVQLEADPPLVPQPFVERPKGGVHAGGRPDRPQGVVLVGGGDAEDGHDRVAGELLHRAAVVADHRPHGVVVAGHDLGQRLGVEPLAERGRAAQVAEQHGDGLAGATRPADPGQGLAAGQAEPRPPGVRLPAGGTADRLPRITPYARTASRARGSGRA
jgi:hypothetical protein